MANLKAANGANLESFLNGFLPNGPKWVHSKKFLVRISQNLIKVWVIFYKKK